MYFFNDNFLEIKKFGIKEGGVVRNNAWIRYLKDDCKMKVTFVNFVFTNKILKYLNYVYFCFRCIFIKNSKIFFLYPKVGLPILTKGGKGDVYRKVFLVMVKKLIANGNDLIFDVSDVKYEQAIDLRLDNLDLPKIKVFEDEFFSLGQYYVFASYSMKEYIQNKYNIDEQKCEVCINGGYEFLKCDKKFDIVNKDKISYVYAGTLNKGRMIEEMINVFPNASDKELILIGTGGEWINEFLSKCGKTNVQYYGEFVESEASLIVSQCDVGLIPYDSSRFYYNIAYPTKLSFYITAGIPFLSTPVNEVKLVLNHYKIGYAAEIEDWTELIDSLTKDNIEKLKDDVKMVKHNFYWKEVFKKSVIVNGTTRDIAE